MSLEVRLNAMADELTERAAALPGSSLPAFRMRLAAQALRQCADDIDPATLFAKDNE